MADVEEKDLEIESEFSEPFSPPSKPNTPSAKRSKFERCTEANDKFNEGLLTIMKESNEILKEQTKQRSILN